MYLYQLTRHYKLKKQRLKPGTDALTRHMSSVTTTGRDLCLHVLQGSVPHFTLIGRRKTSPPSTVLSIRNCNNPANRNLYTLNSQRLPVDSLCQPLLSTLFLYKN